MQLEYVFIFNIFEIKYIKLLNNNIIILDNNIIYDLQGLNPHFELL